jgi:hypothetical protein
VEARPLISLLLTGFARRLAFAAAPDPVVLATQSLNPKDTYSKDTFQGTG